VLVDVIQYMAAFCCALFSVIQTSNCVACRGRFLDGWEILMDSRIVMSLPLLIMSSGGF